MPSSSRHDLHDLALRAEAEHLAASRASEVRVQSELERRRGELASEQTRLLQRIRLAAGV